MIQGASLISLRMVMQYRTAPFLEEVIGNDEDDTFFLTPYKFLHIEEDTSKEHLK